MFETQSIVGKERILASGSAVLGPEDREFTVVFTVATFRKLTFTIQISTDSSGAAGLVFPHMIVPLFVHREKSIRALEEAMRSDVYILLATQKNPSDDNPATDSIYEVGTLASVLELLKLPDGTVEESPDGTVEELEDGTVKVLVDRRARPRPQIWQLQRLLPGRSRCACGRDGRKGRG